MVWCKIENLQKKLKYLKNGIAKCVDDEIFRKKKISESRILLINGLSRWASIQGVYELGADFLMLIRKH